MIKILFFIENLSAGGAEKVLCNLVNEMDQSKFEITVQTLWNTNPDQYLKPGIRYKSCYTKRNRINQYRSRLEAALGLTYPLHIRGNYDIEVAYLEFGPTKILSRSTNKAANKIAWVHSDLAHKLAGKAEIRKKVARQYAAYDKIVCVSHTAKESFVQLFGRKEVTYVLYNTVDDSSIREESELIPQNFPPKRRLTVASVGRLSVEKQYDLLLRIHKRLLEDGLLHDLWIIGEGDERSRLEAYVEENHLSESVKLFGYRENPYPYIKTADLLVCSSLYEGLSTFITEGLILGKPIVTTECSGMQELLGDSEYGLITENSEEGLYRGLSKMLMDDAVRQQYKERAVSRGGAFSARKLTETTERFFINTVEG